MVKKRAASKRINKIDTRMKFSIQPPPGESAFDQWRDAMKAVCRLPMGIPTEFRKKAWLSLADHYLFQLKINWEKTVRFVFNERSNPDDEQLGLQIVKDLHRTGCSNFSGEENDEDRAILKRLLLAYARWNKRVGYCQGFNVIAALLLNVMDRREDDALKVMIYLIDSVLPESYFANNLRALSVDMAVFRDLLRLTYPKLSSHLDKLQLAAQDVRTGACYEPPLPNVFTMQWFLTLFATCLPIHTVLRVWDSIMFEGSEILLRTALTIWGKLAKRIMSASSADEFYCLMGELTSSIMQGSILEEDSMLKSIYALGEFPFPQLNELREKYTYNIRPFTPASAATGNGANGKNQGGRSRSSLSLRSLLQLKSSGEDEELDDEDITAMACMPGDVSGSSDISVLGPGVYGEGRGSMSSGQRGSDPPAMERMTMDIQSLKLQYQKLKQRQQQAHVIIAAASAKKGRAPTQQEQHRVTSNLPNPPSPPSAMLVTPSIQSPTAMNHLFVGKATSKNGVVGTTGNVSSSAKNRLVTKGPLIAGPGNQWKLPGGTGGRLSTQMLAVARAQAVSKSKRMRTGISAATAAAHGRSGNGSDSDCNNDDQADDKSDINSYNQSCNSVGENDYKSETISQSKNSNDIYTKKESVLNDGVTERIEGDNVKHAEKPSLISSCENIVASNGEININSSNTFHQSQVTTGDPQQENNFPRHESNKGEDNALVPGIAENQNIKDIPNTYHHGDSPKTASVENSKFSPSFEDSGVDSSPANSPMLFSSLSLPTKSSYDNDSLEEEMILRVEKEAVDVRLGESQNLVSHSKNGEKCFQSIHVTMTLGSSGITAFEGLSVQSENNFHRSDSSDVENNLASPTVVSKVMRGQDNNSQESGTSSDMETGKSLEDAEVSAGLNVHKVDNDENLCNNPTDATQNLADRKALSQNSTPVLNQPSLSSSCDQHSLANPSQDLCPTREARSTSLSSTDSISVLLETVATSSPIKEHPYIRSTSMIETVPITENLELGLSKFPSVESCSYKNQSSLPMKKEEASGDSISLLSSKKKSHNRIANQRSKSIRMEQIKESSITDKKSQQSVSLRRLSLNPNGVTLSQQEATTRRLSLNPNGVTLSQHDAQTSRLSQPFNPFPVKHLNTNRVKTGLKLGLYTPSTLDQLRGLKSRTTSS